MVDGPYSAPISKVDQLFVPMPVLERLGLTTGSTAFFLVPDFLPSVALVIPEPVMHEWLKIGLDVVMATAQPRSAGLPAPPIPAGPEARRGLSM